MAIKRIPDVLDSKRMGLAILREVSILRQLSGVSPLVPKVYDMDIVFDHRGNTVIFIVMEYFKWDLNKYLKEKEDIQES